MGGEPPSLLLVRMEGVSLNLLEKLSWSGVPGVAMAASCFLSVMARKPTTRGKGFQSGSIVPDYQTVVALPPACPRPGTVPVHLIHRWRSEGVRSHCGVSIIPGYSRWPSSCASHLSPAPGMSLGKGTAWCWTPDFILSPHTLLA